jgi:DNA-3-methyladenine glycosylase
MYMDGGHLYVFLVYGMHHCANVVTRPAGIPEAVLLRAAESTGQTPAKLLSGPGKLCAALGITVEYSGTDLLSDGDLCLFKAPGETPDIGVSKRIGVDYAGDAAEWPLRFFDLNSASVSGPPRLS